MASIQKLVRTHVNPVTGKSSKKVSYRVFIRISGLKPITKSFSTKKLALAFAVRIESNHEAANALGGPVATLLRSMTLAELIDRYMSQYRGKDQTINSRLSWWKTRFGACKLEAINKPLIRDALSELASGEGSRGHGRGRNITIKSTGRPRTPATINRYKASLASVFKYGMDQLDLPNNPCRAVPNATENNRRIRFLSQKERITLLDACKQSEWPRLYLLVSMAITTGARKSEILQLRWSDIDLNARRAYVSMTKNGEPRVLPLTTDVVRELTKFREFDSSLIFPSDRKPGLPFEFTKHWKQALGNAHIDNFRFHDLRHTCASYLANEGASLLQIAEVLGHKSMAMTQRYSHLCVNHKQSLIDQVMGNILEVKHEH